VANWWVEQGMYTNIYNGKVGINRVDKFSVPLLQGVELRSILILVIPLVTIVWVNTKLYHSVFYLWPLYVQSYQYPSLHVQYTSNILYDGLEIFEFWTMSCGIVSNFHSKN
jgi:hypothetical protein